jgi:2,4-dienoyl-CoA reductase-like NADH-dependent reductase (Old Yellow Enzyme family)
MTSSQHMLGSPLQIRGLALKNRVMISPMCMYSAIDGQVGDFHLAHLGRFAMGGAGLVFVEATAVARKGRITVGCVGLWDDAQIAGLGRIAGLLHSLGAAAGIQLSHAGRKGSSERPWEGSGPLLGSQTPDCSAAWDTVSVTSEPAGRTWPVPHELSTSEIEAIVGDFASAARRADRAGFDVIELHCAHGYLLHQFLSPISNTRQDEYGGSLQGRMKFPLAVAEAVRSAWPSDRPLFARLSSVDGIDIGWSIEESVVFSKELKARGVDVIDCSSGGMRLPKDKQLLSRTPGFHLPYSEAIRDAADIPTVAVGLIRDAEHAEEILAEGKADLIAVAREALFNPNWALHAFLSLDGPAAWPRWPEQHGWWLERRAEQQGDEYGHVRASARAA